MIHMLIMTKISHTANPRASRQTNHLTLTLQKVHVLSVEFVALHITFISPYAVIKVHILYTLVIFFLHKLNILCKNDTRFWLWDSDYSWAMEVYKSSLHVLSIWKWSMSQFFTMSWSWCCAYMRQRFPLIY